MSVQSLHPMAVAYIQHHLHPGSMTADGEKDPFLFLGIRPACTTTEVQRRYDQLREVFHHTKVQDCMAAFVQHQPFMYISDQDSVCKTVVILCCTGDSRR